jgi:hypothetical protein
MLNDLRRALSFVLGSDPDPHSSTGVGMGGVDREGLAWLRAQLEAQGYRRTRAAFGRPAHSWEEVVEELRMVRAWTEKHAAGVALRLTEGDGFWCEWAALPVEALAGAEPAASEALDLFGGAEPALPVAQGFCDELRRRAGLGLLSSEPGFVRLTADKGRWQDVLKLKLQLGRVLPGWDLDLDRDAYVLSVALDLYAPSVEDQLPWEALRAAGFLGAA